MRHTDAWTSDTERYDGLYIHRRANETWEIIPGKAMAVEVCPCCDKPFVSAVEARRIADRMYPPEPPPMAA